MGSKGTKNYERELSPEELQLFQTQNEMMQAGIGIAQQAEDRSQNQYQQWQATYEPIETGLIPQGATRETGYYSPQQLQGSPALFQGTPQGLAQEAMTRPTGRPVSQPQTWSSPLQRTIPQGTAAIIDNTAHSFTSRYNAGKGA